MENGVPEGTLSWLLRFRSKTQTEHVIGSSMETSAQCSVVTETPDQVLEIPRKETE